MAKRNPPQRRRWRFTDFIYTPTIIPVAILFLFLIYRYKFIRQEFSGIVSHVFHTTERSFAWDYIRMERNLKVYIYRDIDLGGYFEPPTELTGMYGSEAYFFKNIKESIFRTINPLQAQLYFIPISWHQMRSLGTSYEKMTTIVENYVQSLISKYPYWNQSDGTDHFFVICHDNGVEVADGVPFLKYSIRLLCPSTYDTHSLLYNDIALPPVNQSFSHPPGGIDLFHLNRTRWDPWVLMPNSEVRHRLEHQWRDDTELDSKRVWNDTAEGYLLLHDKVYRTKFCICTHGFPVNTALVADSIRYGCIPVIFTNYLDFPFSVIIDWTRFSIVVNEVDVSRLKNILNGIGEAQFSIMQDNLRKVQKNFQWNSPPLRYDAFHMVMYDLWLHGDF
ncbi:probable glycosyltransferase At3g07620 [Corylus avellana]|uniref:probable glycosyltransferase At3g07620 n=1 Tax=Corylus avellana TaxID=13451 RepID=UPI00286B8CF5|nr:probable glycosyltransferase At3g07620 [Corylus avellana]